MAPSVPPATAPLCVFGPVPTQPARSAPSDSVQAMRVSFFTGEERKRPLEQSSMVVTTVIMAAVTPAVSETKAQRDRRVIDRWIIGRRVRIIVARIRIAIGIGIGDRSGVIDRGRRRRHHRL